MIDRELMYEVLLWRIYEAIYRLWALTHCQERKKLQCVCQKLRLMPRYIAQYLSLLGMLTASITIPYDEDCDNSRFYRSRNP